MRTHSQTQALSVIKVLPQHFQLNVLISLVAHGCLEKQQSQLQKAESIHLRGCQSGRQRAEVSALPEKSGRIIFSQTKST